MQIWHGLQTTLYDVGFQVWMGALGMVDFMLENANLFHDKRILELGGGVGLASLVAGLITKEVLLTDVGETILRLAEMNYYKNSSLFKSENNFKIQELDWHKTELIKSLNITKPDIIIACDVIYDNNITDSFLKTLQQLLTDDTYGSSACSKIKVYISTEKRLNFTLEDMDITCKEYDHFKQGLENLLSAFNPSLAMHRIDMTKIPQYCQYDRTSQLEVWELEKTL